MNKKQLTAIYYLSYIASMLGVIIFVLILMEKIETATVIIEKKIKDRDITDIIDQEYRLEMTTVKTTEDEFLNELTSFFFNFHKNSVKFRQKLHNFAIHRNQIIGRFKKSKIHFYDLSIEPSKAYPHFILDLKEFGNDYRTVPFFKSLKIKQKDPHKNIFNKFFMCYMRMAIRSFVDTTIESQMTELSDNSDKSKYMYYRIKPNEDNIINMNRVIHIKSLYSSNIGLRIKGTNKVIIEKLEARCVMFQDV